MGGDPGNPWCIDLRVACGQKTLLPCLRWLFSPFSTWVWGQWHFLQPPWWREGCEGFWSGKAMICRGNDKALAGKRNGKGKRAKAEKKTDSNTTTVTQYVKKSKKTIMKLIRVWGKERKVTNECQDNGVTISAIWNEHEGDTYVKLQLL